MELLEERNINVAVGIKVCKYSLSLRVARDRLLNIADTQQLSRFKVLEERAVGGPVM